MSRPSRKAAGKGAAAERKPRAGAEKPSVQKKVPGKPFVPGDPRINRTKPGPGRPTDRFKEWCRRQVMSKTTRRAVRRILRNKNHPAFKAMWSELAAHGHGRPEAKMEVAGKLTIEQLVAASNTKE